MARTKKDRSAPKTPEQPAKRRRSKGPPVADPPAPAAPVREASEPPKDDDGPQEGLELTWDNFGEIKKHFGLNDTETIRVLTSLIGPDPKRTSAAAPKPLHVKREPVIKEPVNKEPLNKEPVNKKAVNKEPVNKENDHACMPPVPAPAEAPAKRRRLRQMAVETSDNQLGDPVLYPDLHPECYEAETNETEMEMTTEEAEEEEPEHDGELNPDEIGVSATTGNNDDQDSPQGGAAAETAATETAVELEAPEPTEPVRVPVPKPDDPAELAKKQLEENLKKAPTPGRQGRHIVEAKRVDSGQPRVKSLRFFSIL